MISEEFRIPYPESKAGQKQWAKDYGMNAYYAGKHWSIRKRDAEYWHWLVRAAMEEQNIRRVPLRSRLSSSSIGMTGLILIIMLSWGK